MLTQNPNLTCLAFVFIATVLFTQSCTQEQMSITKIMRKKDKSFDPLSAIVGVQVGRSSTCSDASNTALLTITSGTLKSSNTSSLESISISGTMTAYRQ